MEREERRKELAEEILRIMDDISDRYAHDPAMREWLNSKDVESAAVAHLLTPSERALKAGEGIKLSKIVRHVGISSNEELFSVLSPFLKAGFLQIERGKATITERGHEFFEELRKIKKLASQEISAASI